MSTTKSKRQLLAMLASAAPAPVGGPLYNFVKHGTAVGRLPWIAGQPGPYWVALEKMNGLFANNPNYPQQHAIIRLHGTNHSSGAGGIGAEFATSLAASDFKDYDDIQADFTPLGTVPAENPIFVTGVDGSAQTETPDIAVTASQLRLFFHNNDWRAPTTGAYDGQSTGDVLLSNGITPNDASVRVVLNGDFYTQGGDNHTGYFRQDALPAGWTQGWTHWGTARNRRGNTLHIVEQIWRSSNSRATWEGEILLPILRGPAIEALQAKARTPLTDCMMSHVGLAPKSVRDLGNGVYGIIVDINRFNSTTGGLTPYGVAEIYCDQWLNVLYEPNWVLEPDPADPDCSVYIAQAVSLDEGPYRYLGFTQSNGSAVTIGMARSPLTVGAPALVALDPAIPSSFDVDSDTDFGPATGSTIGDNWTAGSPGGVARFEYGSSDGAQVFCDRGDLGGFQNSSIVPNDYEYLELSMRWRQTGSWPSASDLQVMVGFLQAYTWFSNGVGLVAAPDLDMFDFGAGLKPRVRLHSRVAGSTGPITRECLSIGLDWGENGFAFREWGVAWWPQRGIAYALGESRRFCSFRIDTSAVPLSNAVRARFSATNASPSNGEIGAMVKRARIRAKLV
ncbi:MAG: hypothetical protein AAFR84_00940 [Pseudomonadota bacterium]